MTEQKRKHLRLPVATATFIELVSPLLGNSGTGRVITCKTLNVSRGGLQVNLAQELTVGAILQIGVDLPDTRDTLYLAGEVRWCLPNDDSRRPWSAGFKLLNAGDSDIERWVALLLEMER